MFGLSDYFENPNTNILEGGYFLGSIGEYFEKQDAEKKAVTSKIALIGINETRNAFNGQFDAGADQIRNQLYKLAQIAKVSIVDLGNLKIGNKVKDTYASITYLTKSLVNKGIIPLFFGGSQELSIYMLNALYDNSEELGFTVIDSQIDYVEKDFHSKGFLNQVDTQKTTLSIIANQVYFNSPSLFALAEEKFWNIARLGMVRNNYNHVEPLFRDTDILSFDVSSIRYSDFQSATFKSPNGLYAEEACQLANLVGLSDRVKVFNLAEFNAANDDDNQSSSLCAQIIWHFILGVSKRKNDFPVKELAKYKKIYVKLDKIDVDLIFYENQENKRFWVEIPASNSKTKILACSEADYIMMCNNEIPDRIFRNISKFL